MPPIKFFLIGTPKSATTTLCYHLDSHPQVALCRPKEPNFFNQDRWYSKGYSYYESLYPDRPGALAMGEGTTWYCQVSSYPETPARIHSYAPDARIVYTVRDPLDRIRSHVRQRRGDRLCDPRASLLDVIRAAPDLLESGRYYTHLRTYQQHFPEHQIKVLFYEDFVQNPVAVFDELAEFIGIDPSLRTTDLREVKNSGHHKAADPAWVWHAKSVMHVGRILPSQPKHFIYRFLHRPLPTDYWTAEAVEFVRSELEDEVSAFLSAVGRPSDYWSWDVPFANV